MRGCADRSADQPAACLAWLAVKCDRKCPCFLHSDQPTCVCVQCVVLVLNTLKALGLQPEAELSCTALSSVLHSIPSYHTDPPVAAPPCTAFSIKAILIIITVGQKPLCPSVSSITPTQHPTDLLIASGRRVLPKLHPRFRPPPLSASDTTTTISAASSATQPCSPTSTSADHSAHPRSPSPFPPPLSYRSRTLLSHENLH